MLARVLRSGAYAVEPVVERATHFEAAPTVRDWLEARPCGSEVIATELLSEMPVRRAVAQRAAQQTAGGVRGVLERFALASPHVAVVLHSSSASSLSASSSSSVAAEAATAARRPAWSFPGARSTREAFGVLFGHGGGEVLELPPSQVMARESYPLPLWCGRNRSLCSRDRCVGERVAHAQLPCRASLPWAARLTPAPAVAVGSRSGSAPPRHRQHYTSPQRLLKQA